MERKTDKQREAERADVSSSFCKDTNPTESGPTLMTSFALDYLHKYIYTIYLNISTYTAYIYLWINTAIGYILIS